MKNSVDGPRFFFLSFISFCCQFEREKGGKEGGYEIFGGIRSLKGHLAIRTAIYFGVGVSRTMQRSNFATK